MPEAKEARRRLSLSLRRRLSGALIESFRSLEPWGQVSVAQGHLVCGIC